MNRRSFLKWFGASAAVAATTNPLELLEGMLESGEIEPQIQQHIAAGGAVLLAPQKEYDRLWESFGPQQRFALPGGFKSLTFSGVPVIVSTKVNEVKFVHSGRVI